MAQAAPRTVTAADVSVRWLPAEAILTGKWSAATDIYSYSVLLWELFGDCGSGLIAGPHAASALHALLWCTRIDMSFLLLWCTCAHPLLLLVHFQLWCTHPR